MIDPDCGRMIAEAMTAAVEEAGGPVALIVQPPVRRSVTGLLRNRVPQALVLSIQELPATQAVEVVATISGAAPQGQAALPPTAPPTQSPQSQPESAFNADELTDIAA